MNNHSSDRFTVRTTGRTVAMVTGSLALIFIVAELTDSLVQYAGILAMLVILSGVFFYYGFVAAHPWRVSRHRAQAASVSAAALAAIVFVYGVRSHNATARLAELIPSLPEHNDIDYIASGPELQVIAGLFGSFNRRSGLPAQRMTSEQRFWRVETRMTESQVFEHYSSPTHRGQWTVEDSADGMLFLHRGNARMMIMTAEDWGGTIVWYVYLGA